MEGLVTVGLLAVFALLAAAPFLRPSRRQTYSSGAEERREALEARKRELVATLRDLRLDFHMGKLDEKDFRELEARYRKEATDVLRELDRVSGGRKALEAERLIASSRQKKMKLASAARGCPSCGRPLEPFYRFCPACGRGLEAGAPSKG